MKFRVSALSREQKLHTLVVDAGDEAGARAAAAAQGLQALRVSRAMGLPWRQRGSSFSVLLFSQELLSLLDAGLSLHESLEALAEKAPSAEARVVLEAMLAKLSEGMRFSDAVALRPDLFSPLYVGTLKAAERTGDLARAMQRFVDYQSRVDQLRSQIIGACIYPAILLSVGMLVMFFLLGYVVPSFASVYRDSGREMPTTSRWLMAWGEMVSQHGSWVVAGAAAVVGLIAAVLWRAKGPGGWTDLFKRLPVVGEQARLLELSRLYLTLGMLLEGGIAILQALEMATHAMSAPLRRQVLAARADVADGQPMSHAFEAHQLATPVAQRMLRVGERSGQLGLMLTRAALFHETESARFIERFSKSFEPVLMAAIGIVIGAIVVMLYMPIFDLAGSIQ
ncbi:MAG: hypothetical protein RLZZ618_59 [Pseudomonadota bacterium]